MDGFVATIERVMVLLMAAAVAGCSARANRDQESITPPVAGIAAQGFVEPAGEVHRVTFLRDGTITQMLIQAGAAVQAGQPLAYQDGRACAAQLAEASCSVALAEARLEQLKAGKSGAELAAARADLDEARSDHAFAHAESVRYRALKSAAAATEADTNRWASLEDAAGARVAKAAAWLEHLTHFVRTGDVVVAVQEVALATARRDSAMVALEERTLRSPIQGTVVETMKRSGEATGPSSGEPVLLLADLSALRVRAEIEELSALLVETGAVCRIVAPGGVVAITGTVAEVRAAMGRKTVFSKSARERRDLDTRDVLIALPPGASLPVGLRVDVLVAGREAHARFASRPP